MLCSQALSSRAAYKQAIAVAEEGGADVPAAAKPPKDDTGVVVTEAADLIHDVTGEVESDEIIGDVADDGDEDDSDEEEDDSEDEDEEPEDLDGGEDPPPQMKVTLCKHNRGPMPQPVPSLSTADRHLGVTLSQGTGPTNVLVLVDLDFRLSERVASSLLGPAISEAQENTVAAGKKAVEILKGEFNRRDAALQAIALRLSQAVPGSKRSAEDDRELDAAMLSAQQVKTRLDSVIKQTIIT